MNATMKHLRFWMVAALVIFLFWIVSGRIQKNERQLSFSDFMAQLERSHVAKVVLTGSESGTEIVGEFKNGLSIRTYAPPGMDELVVLMLQKGVEVTVRDNASSWSAHIVS